MPKPRARNIIAWGLRVSPDGKLLATLVDDDGSERFKLVIRDLATGKDLETVTKVGIGNPVWTSDSRVSSSPRSTTSGASYRAQYHRIGNDPAKAVTLYEEKDDIAFSVGAARSTDDSLIFISTGNNSRTRCVSCRRPGRAADDDQAAPARHSV